MEQPTVSLKRRAALHTPWSLANCGKNKKPILSLFLFLNYNSPQRMKVFLFYSSLAISSLVASALRSNSFSTESMDSNGRIRGISRGYDSGAVIDNEVGSTIDRSNGRDDLNFNIDGDRGTLADWLDSHGGNGNIASVTRSTSTSTRQSTSTTAQAGRPTPLIDPLPFNPNAPPLALKPTTTTLIGANNAAGSSTVASSLATHTVSVTDRSFEPAYLLVNVNDYVIWQFNSGLSHSISQTKGNETCTDLLSNGFDSGMKTSSSVRFQNQFTAPGQYLYISTISNDCSSNGMKGVIEVRSVVSEAAGLSSSVAIALFITTYLTIII